MTWRKGIRRVSYLIFRARCQIKCEAHFINYSEFQDSRAFNEAQSASAWRPTWMPCPTTYRCWGFSFHTNTPSQDVNKLSVYFPVLTGISGFQRSPKDYFHTRQMSGLGWPKVALGQLCIIPHVVLKTSLLLWFLFLSGLLCSFK